MKRREFLKMLSAAGVSVAFAPHWIRAAEAAVDSYTGDLLIFINTQGGWDPLQFCDPKAEFRNFGNNAIASAGNIRYARLSTNETGATYNYAFDFFDTFHDRMVVVNGINMQTNAHSAGITNAFQGTFASGYPTLSAAFAGVKAPTLPMSYMVTGNYRSTGGLLPYTALSDASLIEDLSLPNVTGAQLDNNLRITPTHGHRMPQDVFARVAEAQRARRRRLLEDSKAMPRWREMLQYFDSAVEGNDAVEALGSIIPEEGFRDRDERGIPNELVKQADIFLHSMAAGLTSAVDAEFSDQPFDTHANHDRLQGERLAELVYGIRFIHERAAEIDARLETNLAGRIVIVIVSDFGRTPIINSDGGTDHWPTTSAIVMRESFSTNGIGNRNVGFSDDEYRSGRINPLTLERSETGIEITSAHIHDALRRHLGIAGAPQLGLVGLPIDEELALFNGAVQTPQAI